MTTTSDDSVDTLNADGVRLLYDALLGREAGEHDLTHHLATSQSVQQLAEVILASAEYAQRNPSQARTGRDPLIANLWHPDLARWTHPVGRRSADDVAIVGREGWIFLCGGSNRYVPQFTGELAMPSGWLQEWKALIAARQTQAQAAGRSVAFLVIPEKVAVLEEHYPEPLTRQGLRPIERLISEADLPLTYPLQELRVGASDQQVCLVTDSHFTPAGNAIIHAALMRSLSVHEEAPEVPASRDYVVSGDLGSKFAPNIMEVMHAPHSLGQARIVEDNWDQIREVGGHIGTRRIWRNDNAPDPRCVVLFGDSYGFGAESYQGTSWFLAQTFAEVHFVWAPFGWDPKYLDQVGAQVVVCQTAERFMARVPRPSLDVETLTAEALARSSFVAVEEIFSGPDLTEP